MKMNALTMSSFSKPVTCHHTSVALNIIITITVHLYGFECPRQKSNIILTLQEPQRNHQRVISRDPALSNSSGADPPPYSSLLCSNKDGGSTASSPRAPSSPSSYTVAIGRKDLSIIRHSPGLNGQQKLQGSPNHTPRPSLISTTSLTPHAGPKSRFSDVKYRKTSQPLCSQQSPHSRSKVNKPGKELKEHKKPNKLVKKERKGEERKRRKKKEEKRLADRKKKRDKAAKKERKLGFKSEFTEKEMFTSISTSNPTGEAKMSKTTTLSPENQGQSPPKHKHRMRSERAERTHKPSTKTPHASCTSPQPSSKSENHKMPKKNSSFPKPPVKEQLKHSLSRNSSPAQTKKKPTIVSTKSEDGPKAKSDDTLPSLLFKALAPLTTGCSVSLEQPIHGKQGGQGGVLNAPDLQPVAVMGNLQEMGDNLANTPPVLSWQGSPVSALGEDEEELEKGVMSRPVLQPSPTQCFSPPPVDSESFDDLNKEPCEGTLANHSHNGMSKLSELPCATEKVPVEEKEEEDNSGETSESLLCELRHHKTGLDDVFKSLTTFVEGQRVTCRGGPFGGPAAGNTRGVKYSSSLALGPEIHCPEHQDFCPESDPTASAKPDNQSPIHTTSDTLLKSHNVTDLREPVTDSPVQEKREEIENDTKEKPEGKDIKILAERSESSFLDGSLSAKLMLTTTHEASFTSHVTVSTKKEGGNSEDTQHIGTDRKRKQKAKDGGNEEEIKIKIKAEESRVICPKNKANEISSLKERESLVHVISRNSPRILEDSTKGQIPQKNQNPHGKDIQREKENTGKTEGKKLTDKPEDVSELENLKSSAVGNINTKSPSSASTATINTSKSCVSTPASKTPYSLTSVDPLKLKALSMGLSKELKILLIKVESAGRQTFNISEVEEQRIPLSKINIKNKASEVVRACK